MQLGIPMTARRPATRTPLSRRGPFAPSSGLVGSLVCYARDKIGRRLPNKSPASTPHASPSGFAERFAAS